MSCGNHIGARIYTPIYAEILRKLRFNNLSRRRGSAMGKLARFTHCLTNQPVGAKHYEFAPWRPIHASVTGRVVKPIAIGAGTATSLVVLICSLRKLCSSIKAFICPLIGAKRLRRKREINYQRNHTESECQKPRPRQRLEPHTGHILSPYPL